MEVALDSLQHDGVARWDTEFMARQTSEAVDEYLRSFPESAQKSLADLRGCMLSNAPQAVEEIKWSHPAYSQGTILFAFAGFARHANFYCTPSTIRAFAEELSALTTGKSSVQFPYGKPLAANLLGKMIAYRIREYEEDGITWM